MSDVPLSELVGRTFNGYRIERYIARGGMGVVFQGVQESLDRPVAIKILYPHLSSDAQFRERFTREARAIGRLNHPHIAGVLDYGLHDNHYYMVLEFVDGTNLREALAQVGSQGLQLRSDAILSIVRQVGGALTYAHNAGLVHRDVKPSNILLDHAGHAYLTDFGVVKMVGMTQITTAGTSIGTPEYMAPEQATEVEVGPAADIYALAIVAYEMLVGRAPFQSPTPIGVLHQQLNSTPPPASSIVPWSTPQIDATFARALAKQPGERHASMQEFVTDLEAALATSWQADGVDLRGLVSGALAGGATETADAVVAGIATPGAPDSPIAAASTSGGGVVVPAMQSSPALVPAGVTGNVVAASPSSMGTPVTDLGSPSADNGGDMPPPVVPPVATGANGPGDAPGGRRRGTALAGGVLVLLLIAAVAGFFIFANEDDDGDDDQAVGGSGGSGLGASGAGQTAASPSAVIATATEGGVPVAAAETPTTAPTPAPEPTQAPVATEAPPTVATTPTAAPLPEMVIYYAYKPQDEHNPQIYVMNLDGSGSRLFAEARGHSWGPRVSSDGTLLLFSSVTREEHTVHTPDGGGLVGSGNHDIYVLNVTGESIETIQPSNLTNVTNPLPSWDNGWSWSADDNWIAFTSDRPDATGSTDWEIYVMRPDGSEVRQITDTPSNEGWPVWTPDGEQIVFASDATGNSEIYIMDADGQNPQQLTNRPQTVDLYPSVSPDGERIVFSSQLQDGSEGNIWIMDLDGGNLQQLTSTAALNNIPSFCPAGDLIVFVSNIRGNDNIFSMRSDGSGVQQLTQEPDQILPGAPENTTPSCSVLPNGG